jgi:anti-sigma regulatory factor (Ser/Thr protein kinase)
VSEVFPVDPSSVAAARRWLLSTLDARWAPVRDVAALLVSELVTNAVRHARRVLRVVIRTDGRTLRVEVTDDCQELPRVQDLDDAATSGRGLQLVAAIADRWGVTPSDDGKSVWFEVGLPVQAGAGRGGSAGEDA